MAWNSLPEFLPHSFLSEREEILKGLTLFCELKRIILAVADEEEVVMGWDREEGGSELVAKVVKVLHGDAFQSDGGRAAAHRHTKENETSWLFEKFWRKTDQREEGEC